MFPLYAQNAGYENDEEREAFELGYVESSVSMNTEWVAGYVRLPMPFEWVSHVSAYVRICSMDWLILCVCVTASKAVTVIAIFILTQW